MFQFVTMNANDCGLLIDSLATYDHNLERIELDMNNDETQTNGNPILQTIEKKEKMKPR